MPKLFLNRFVSRWDMTLGIIRDEDNKVHCYTMERPYLDNREDVSCIPSGTYEVVPYSSEKFSPAFKLLDVPERTDILIHNGNFISDTKGCILVGDRIDKTNDKTALTNSRITLKELTDKFPEGFSLVIS